MGKHYLYRWIDVNNKVIYVGESSRPLRKRVSEHMSCKKSNTNFRSNDMKNIYKIEYIEFDRKNEYDAMAHERYYISLWKPRLNKAEKYTGAKFDPTKRTDWKLYKQFDHNYLRVHGSSTSHKLSFRENFIFYTIAAVVVGFLILR